MAEGGEDIPMDNLGSHGDDDEDESSGAPYYARPEDVPGYEEKWRRYREEEERRKEAARKSWEEAKRQSDADKFKGKVSGKTLDRWKSQEEEQQGNQGKTWSWEDNQGYEEYKEHHGLEMKDRGGTIRSSTSKEGKVEETSFGGTPSLENKGEEQVGDKYDGIRGLDERVKERKEVEKAALDVYPYMNRNRLPRIKFDDYSRLVYKGDRTWKDGEDHNKTYVIAVNGRPSNNKDFPKGLKRDLGKSNVEINDEDHEKQKEEEKNLEKQEEELNELRRARDKISVGLLDDRSELVELGKELDEYERIIGNSPTTQEAEEVRKRLPEIKERMGVVKEKIGVNEQNLSSLDQAITEKETGVRNGQVQVGDARERVDQSLLSLRDRVKEIFKKYGFTVFSVASAIGIVIGVVVSSLKAGLTKVAKGVGNGLKELGKKLGQILPGMIGAIASFLFRTAGEVIGFLAKNAWLLVVGLVVLAVEQFKKRSR